MRTSKLNMILKEEIVLGIYSWLHMTPVSMLVRNITSDQGGDYAIVRFTVDSRGVQMGPKAVSYTHLDVYKRQNDYCYYC